MLDEAAVSELDELDARSLRLPVSGLRVSPMRFRQTTGCDRFPELHRGQPDVSPASETIRFVTYCFLPSPMSSVGCVVSCSSTIF